MFKTIVKIFFILILWALIGAVAYFAAKYFNFPIRTAMMIVGGIFALWLLILIIRKLVIRQRSKKRVDNLINVEESAQSGDEGAASKGSPAESRFRSYIKLLRKSQLKRKGPPLYVLPWYLCLSSDKSMLKDWLNQVDLPKLSPGVRNLQDAFKRLNVNEPGESEWWLTNHSIFIDSPFDSNGLGDEEWTSLLKMLKRYRRKEPINGVIITITCRELLSMDSDSLEEVARSHRTHLDELMRILNLRVPVYVVVTGLDSLDGFVPWSEMLGTARMDECMGQVNRNDEGAATFTKHIINFINSSIKDTMISRLAMGRPAIALLRLPDYFKSFEEPLSAFTKSLFARNPYMISPRLRGLYFTGALKDDHGKVSGTFVKNLLTKLIPADRRLVLNMMGIRPWFKDITKLVPLTFLFSSILFGFVFVWSAIDSWAFLDTVATRFNKQYGTLDYDKALAGRDAAVVVTDDGVTLTGRFAAIKGLEEMRALTVAVENEIESWWIPWFGVSGVTGDPEFVQNMKEAYRTRFQSHLLNPVNDSVQNFVEHISSSSSRYVHDPKAMRHKIVSWINVLTRRIFMLDSVLSGGGVDDLEDIKEEELANEEDALDSTELKSLQQSKRESLLRKLPLPFSYDSPLYTERTTNTEIDALNQGYLQLLIWADEEDLETRRQLERELALLRRQMGTLLRSNNGDLSWLVDWANSEIGLGSTVEVSSFWPGTGSIRNAVDVPAAYTLRGKEIIEEYLSDIERSKPKLTVFSEMKERFLKEYEEHYLEAWRQFALHFGDGQQMLRGREEWLIAVVNLADANRNPYFLAIVEARKQLKPYIDFYEDENIELPLWIEFLDYHHEMVQASREAEKNEVRQESFLSRLGFGGSKMGRMASAATRAAPHMKRFGRSREEALAKLDRAAKSWSEYNAALNDVAFSSKSPSVSYAAMMNIFQRPDNPGGGEGPVAKTIRAQETLEFLLGIETRDNAPFWRLYGGPVKLIEQYMFEETACVLNRKWEEKFLAEIQEVPKNKLHETIFGEQGKLWSFVNDNLKPFIVRKRHAGYVPRRVDEWIIPLSKRFLNFLTQGKAQSEQQRTDFPVLIHAFPTRTNRAATRAPQITRITLQCPGKKWTIDNYNFEVTEKFIWTRQCSDVLLTINMGTFFLSKRYTGTMGLLKFRREFKGSVARFTARDFPGFERNLASLKIKYIDLNYLFKGIDEVENALKRQPLNAPNKIATCWTD